MAHSKLFFFPFFLLLLLQPSTNGETCQQVSCRDVIVDFPFRLRDQPDCCGNPNFNLSCTKKSRTTITFPFSGDFIVDAIGYLETNLLISDPENCIAKHLLQGLDLYGTPFEPQYPESYIFFNCSSFVSIDYPAIYISCLSDTNFMVFAIPTIAYNQSTSLGSCLEIATIFVPLPVQNWPYYLSELLLTWEEPDCQSSCNCENHSRYCEFTGGCNDFKKKSGLSNGAKYALIFALGTPLFFIVVFIIHHKLIVHGNDQRHQSTVEISSLAAEPQLAARTVNGLDGSRIEAYPITLLDESCRLPRPNDNTCSICLSEYQAKETIRTIPDCDHYFHADCIDEWLRLNAACPVCRKSPDQESALIIHSTVPSSSPPPPPL
ncbi:putative RING-H2 finger protein ATL21B [Durio zibethinus]|uniref:RING-type E3 ubiquitin transferase n=1 Tax=Durio zibethinus TaxID=66656 RepID=A0A6P6A8L1_DURZI|nr:putative RING-H2 finger protein ATL21B [Durio zibethinus]